MGDFLALIREKRNLRIRLLVVFLILIYIPMALNVYFVYTRTIDAVEKEKIRDAEQILKKTSETIDFTLISIEETINEIAIQNGIRKGLEDYEQLGPIVQEKIANFIERRVAESKESNYFIDQVICITESGLTFNFGGETTIDADKFFKSELYKKLKLSDSNKSWEYISTEKIFKKANDDNAMVLINKMKSLNEEKNIGYLFTIINKASFTALYKDIILGTTGNMGVYDDFQNPVLGNINYQIPEELFNNLLNNQETGSMKKISNVGSYYYIGATYLKPINWSIKAVIPLEDLTGDIKNHLRSSFWLIGGISILLSIWIIIEVIILSKVITEKEMAHYRLVLSEEMNSKLMVYKHDFLNHLQVIRGLVELDRPDKAIEYLKNVTKEGTGIKDKYEIGIPELESAIFSTISNVEDKNIDVEIESIKISDELPIKIYDLIKIITNLLKNAIQALESYEGKDKKLRIQIFEELDEYVFMITNNKPNIPDDIRMKIFDKGFSTKGNNGRGLGLYIVKRLVEKNNGTIELRVDDNGNHFIVRFPYYL